MPTPSPTPSPGPRLSGRVAVVTGASKGIGAAIARALAAAGAAVVVSYGSDAAGAEAVVRAVREAGGRAAAVHADVTREAEAALPVEAAIREFGRLDVLVNNSGVYSFAPIEEVTEESYRRMFDVNVLGLLLTTKAAVPHLAEGGSIVNVSSLASTLHPPTSAVYSGTKGAVDAITGVLARELGPRGIRVNAVNPGLVHTEGTATMGILGSDFEREAVAGTPLGRAGQPDDIGAAVAFLASDEARWISGETIRTSGGAR